MEEGNYYFSSNHSNDSILCIAPLTDRALAACSIQSEDGAGYFLFEKRASEGGEDLRVIAKVLSEEAALQLKMLLGME